MTYSILGYDRANGDLGVAVQSKFPGVRSLVPYGEAGIGVVATQAFGNPRHGTIGLQLLRCGATPHQAVDVLLHSDGHRTKRDWPGRLCGDGAEERSPGSGASAASMTNGHRIVVFQSAGQQLAAKAGGHSHVLVDGTLISTDRISTPGPTRGVDRWWSGKHRHHRGNIQVVSAPDGWPLWTSDVRPGREHDTTAARADPDLLTQIAAWVDDGRLGLADLGYEGEADLLRTPAAPACRRPSDPAAADGS